MPLYETQGLKKLADKVLKKHTGGSQTLSPKVSQTVPLSQSGTVGTSGTLGTVPTKAMRFYLMRIMTDWNERAAMMTDASCPAEKAELAAWHDLEMDHLFWRVVH